MARQLTKPERRKLRDLAADAHTRELSDAMMELFQLFKRWRAEEISVFELNELVHRFHDGISRELYKRYVMTNAEFSVSYAVRHGILTPGEVGPKLMEALAVTIESVRELSSLDRREE